MFNRDSGEPSGTNRQEATAEAVPGENEGRESSKKSYEEIGREKREAMMASGKSAWEGLKNKISGGGKWLKEKSLSVVDRALAAPEMVKSGVEKVVDGTKEKYDELKEKGKNAFDNVTGRVVSAKDNLMDFINQKLLDRLEEKEAKKQEKLDKRMREKIDPLKARIDEIRSKKRAILARMKNPAHA